MIFKSSQCDFLTSDPPLAHLSPRTRTTSTARHGKLVTGTWQPRPHLRTPAALSPHPGPQRLHPEVSAFLLPLHARRGHLGSTGAHQPVSLCLSVSSASLKAQSPPCHPRHPTFGRGALCQPQDSHQPGTLTPQLNQLPPCASLPPDRQLADTKCKCHPPPPRQKQQVLHQHRQSKDQTPALRSSPQDPVP